MGLMTVFVELGAAGGGSGVVVTLSGLRGGAAGRPLIGLRPNSAARALGALLKGRADAGDDGAGAGLLEGA